MTDELIDRLSAEATPVRRTALATWLAGAVGIGLVGSVLLLFFWLGLRGDYPAAFGLPIFWIKFSYPLLLGLAGLWAVERLARPGGRGRRAFLAMIVLFLAVALAGIVQLAAAPPDEVRTLVMGGTALICPALIVVTGLPVLAAVLLVMRRMAPTRLTLAGFAAGILAGGLGAWVYSFHCGESGLPFLTLWYTLGVLLTAGLGALLGRWALRW